MKQKTQFKTYKDNFYKHVTKDADNKLKNFEKIYEPDSSLNLKNSKKSLIQNYVDTLVDFGKQQTGSIGIDNSTITNDNDMIDITEKNMDKNSDELINIQNEIDTVKRK